MNQIERIPPISSERDKETEKTKNYWEEGRATFEHNGKRIEFYGLAHTPKTLELYREELERSIEESAYVVSELPPSVTVDKIREFLEEQSNVNPQNAQGKPINANHEITSRKTPSSSDTT